MAHSTECCAQKYTFLFCSVLFTAILFCSEIIIVDQKMSLYLFHFSFRPCADPESFTEAAQLCFALFSSFFKVD